MDTRRKVFCDTNILLDIFDYERPGHTHAAALLWYAAENSGTIRLVSAVSSFKDAYYILARLYQDKGLARESVEAIMGDVVEPVDMLAAYGSEALTSNEPDFEDGIIRACAEHESAFAILTRDTRAFTASFVPAMTPEVFLEREGFDYEEIEWE